MSVCLYVIAFYLHKSVFDLAAQFICLSGTMKMKSTGSSSDFMKHVHAAMVVVRQQRQRASLERICRALRLQQLLKNVDEKMVEAELEAATQRGELYVVDKRGYRSYQVENLLHNCYGFCYRASA